MYIVLIHEIYSKLFSFLEEENKMVTQKFQIINKMLCFFLINFSLNIASLKIKRVPILFLKLIK